MTEEEMTQEKKEIKSRLQESCNIIQEITKLKEDPNYLTKDQIENLKV